MDVQSNVPFENAQSITIVECNLSHTEVVAKGYKAGAA